MKEGWVVDELKNRSTGLMPSSLCEDGEVEMSGALSIDEGV